MEISRLLDAPVDDTKKNEEALGSSICQQVLPILPKRKRKWRPSLKQRRDKKKRNADSSKLSNLTLDVNDLRQQIRDCMMQRTIRETRLLLAREQFYARSLHSVSNLLHVFRHGHPGMFSTTEDLFLSRIVHTNIGVGGGISGRAEFIEQWRRYKLLFSVKRVRTFSTKIVTSDIGGCSIECIGEFEGQVTADALQKVFLNSLKDNALVEQVLGRRFVCPTKALITFDVDGRVVQYDAFSNVFEAMSRLLDFNPFRIVTLMADAAITDGSILPSVSDCTRQSCDADECYKENSENGNVSPVSSTTSSRISIDKVLS